MESVNVSVDYLKSIKFSSLSLKEKLKIKSAGRPKPNLLISKCLLFGDEESKWTKNGIKDLVHLSEKIKKHQHSKSHISAKLGFNLLGKQDIRQQLNSAYRLNIAKHNEQIKNNSLIVCQAHIKKEIAASKFVSIVSDGTSDISNIFQMVIVYRYTLPNGTPVERFWTFLKPNNHDAVSLAGCIEECLSCVLSSSDKLISQSYDGASVMSGVHGGVQKLIQDKFRYANYIHCYAHHLNLLMSQATSINTNVRIFFADLTDITNFFSNSPQRVAILDEVVGNRVPSASATRWNFKIRTVNMVYENREALVECMERIQSTSRQSGTITKAGALLRLLNDNKFVFWLKVFHRIMPHVDILYSQIQKTATDSVIVKRCLTTFEENIQKERDNIHTIRDIELTDIDDSQSRKRRKKYDRNSYVSTIIQAKEVCDTILSEIKRRFLFTGHLEITKLFSVDNFEIYSSNFPTLTLESAINNYPFLNKNKLRTELEIVYRRSDFKELSGAVHLLKFLIENNLQEDFSEIYLILQVLVTMPMTTAEAERCFSTLKRIKTFLRSTMGQDRLTALAMLSIEKKNDSRNSKF
ncbi:unnamed protein product [Diabrotica balteata]|uniref:HAT C-terminal dimerisation domain-containing protein n=1 Tax=Diabrotica balteata TaxID=107213 RepID=A0A9N9XBB9_DIABA|nr:unnamed protein product [Diabrotica balteata]